MRKVCIIETESHYEVVRNFVLSIIEKAEFTIVTNSYCEKNLGVIQRDNVAIINYETQESLVLKTMGTGEFDYKLTITPPSYKFYQGHSDWFKGSDLLVHNMNYWFQPFQNIYFFKHPSFSNLKSLGRFFKYWPDLMKRRRLYQEVFARYLAPSEALYENYKSFDKLKGFLRLDYCAYEQEMNSSDSHVIVIPGTVNEFRDYDTALQVVRDVALELQMEIKVLLLGRNPEKRRFKRYENQYLSVKTFVESLSDEEYTRLLRSADFGILPLKEEIEHLGILEKKGSSNISGGVNDLVYAGIRGLIPDFYKISPSKLFLEYSNLTMIYQLFKEVRKEKNIVNYQSNNIEASAQNFIVIQR